MPSSFHRLTGAAKRAACSALAAVGLSLFLAAARAPAAAAEPPPRPKLEVAVGMGASFDDTGLRASGMSAIPAFFVMGGFDGGTFGADLGLFANSANGRFRAPNLPVDRLAVDAMLVVRPGARLPTDHEPYEHERYDLRVARSVAIDAGVGYERASRIARAPEAINRFGFRVGGHVDLPLTPAGAGSELRLRLAVRRFLGLSQSTFPGGDPAPDTRAEIFAALAAVF